jgi:hypothetical protein
MPMITEQKKTTYERGGKSLWLNLENDRLLEAISYWEPPVPHWEPLIDKKRSGLRLACVIGDRLYEGLRFEGEVMLLTPQNWQYILTYGKPDMVLMESVWETATGHWPMSQNMRSGKSDELLTILGRARQLSIPTVYWITSGHEYHPHFHRFAACFDLVFCADPVESEMLRSEGVAAEILLPCVQPLIYNPYRFFDHYDRFHINFLFDGWADLDRLTDELSIMSEIKKYGLSIIESRNIIFKQRLEMLPGYRECILGCLTEMSRATLMRYANAYLTFDQTLSTRTTQQWMSAEAAAARLPVIHRGVIEEDDFRQGFVTDRCESDDFLDMVENLNDNMLSRERTAHPGWRCVNQNHTFSLRIAEICEKMAITHDMKQFPKASIIIPTFRKELIDRCIENFDKQTYPKKELIIVYNGDDKKFSYTMGAIHLNNVRIIKVPGELFAGACMNAGSQESTGDYCFRMDDDDQYGENYILDMMLHLNALDVNIFGKPPSYLKFENDLTVYARRNIHPNCILTRDNLQEGKVWLGGNTICTRKSSAMANHYCNNAYGAADSYYMLNSNEAYYAMTDMFNLIAERREDQSTHTWKIDSKALKNKTTALSKDMKLFFV